MVSKPVVEFFICDDKKISKKGLENYGKKWTQEEKVQVLSDYKNKIPVKDIANKYKRTIGAGIYFVTQKPISS